MLCPPAGYTPYMMQRCGEARELLSPRGTHRGTHRAALCQARQPHGEIARGVATPPSRPPCPLAPSQHTGPALRLLLVRGASLLDAASERGAQRWVHPPRRPPRRRGAPLVLVRPAAAAAAAALHSCHRGAQPRVQVLLVAPRCREPALRPRLAWHPNVFEAARESGPQCWVHATQRAMCRREIA